MKKRTRILIACSIIPAFTVIIDSTHSLGIDDIEKGAGLFTQYCSGCHGEDAIGQDPSQPAGGWDKDENRLAPALNGTGHAWHHPPELLYGYIQNGSIDKTSPMPSFGSILDDNQIRAIIAYFQSLWPDTIKEAYKERFKNKG